MIARRLEYFRRGRASLPSITNFALRLLVNVSPLQFTLRRPPYEDSIFRAFSWSSRVNSVLSLCRGSTIFNLNSFLGLGLIFRFALIPPYWIVKNGAYAHGYLSYNLYRYSSPSDEAFGTVFQVFSQY